MPSLRAALRLKKWAGFWLQWNGQIVGFKMADHKTSCPNCKKVFKVKLEMQGKRCRCAKCQTKFVINIDTPLEQVLSPPTSPKTDPVVVEVKEQFQVPLAQEQDTATTPAMASDCLLYTSDAADE